ncbi:MAG: outer membrane beta-barrel protein [Saprospiraceae bacterium]
MKNLIILFFSLSLISSLNAQDENEDKNILGGSFSFGISKNSSPLNPFLFNNPLSLGSDGDERSTRFSFSPYYGYQANQHWLIGISGVISYQSDKQNTTFITPPGLIISDEFTVNSTYFEIGGFARYLFLPEKKFSMFIQPGLAYIYNLGIGKSPDIEVVRVNKKGFIANARPGAIYKIGNSFQLAATFGYLGLLLDKTTDEMTEEEVDGFSFITNFNFSAFTLGAELRF